MNNSELPIFRSALALALYIETIVKGFEKYHKYTIGEDMRIFCRVGLLTHHGYEFKI